MRMGATPGALDKKPAKSDGRRLSQTVDGQISMTPPVISALHRFPYLHSIILDLDPCLAPLHVPPKPGVFTDTVSPVARSEKGRQGLQIGR